MRNMIELLARPLRLAREAVDLRNDAALALAYDGLRGSGLSAGLIAAVHDEIVFECAEADVVPATAIVHQAMMTGLEQVFGSRPRFHDIALYAVGAPKVGQTWDGDVFDLASLSEKETMVLL